MSTSYITLSRQSGLLTEMRSIANNIANHATSGFRREAVVFSEFITAEDPVGESVSMVAARARHVDLTQGPLTQTGGTFDLAIEGDGFFRLEGSDEAIYLTRAGRFSSDASGALVTPDGLRLLSADGAPILVPPDGREVSVSTDGTMSTSDGALAQIGLVRPSQPNDLTRHPGSIFSTNGGVEETTDGIILQGYVEGANVDPIVEIARMIEVQRAYEFGQAFLDREADRQDDLISTLTR